MDSLSHVFHLPCVCCMKPLLPAPYSFRDREGKMIRKVKAGYKVVSSKGKNLGGPYKTEEEAKKRLRQVEFFKRKKG